MKYHVLFKSVILIAISLHLAGCSAHNAANPSAVDINREASAALDELYRTNSGAAVLGRGAKAVLVFPDMVKAGFLVGAQYGVGALMKQGMTVDFYKSFSASYGLQAGAQKFGYALFFMDKSSLDYLEKSRGWEIGVGPSIVVVDEGIARSLTTTTAREGVYAFIFDQKGLMAGVGLQGTKIVKYEP